MTSERLKELLNRAIARELQVSIQYMWQSVEARGFEGEVIRDQIRKIAITEMTHAESIAKRLVYLGGKPTTKPSEITVGETAKEMMEIDRKAEEEAIKLYREIIETAKKEGDVTTARLFEDILRDEEDHHEFFSSFTETL